MSALPATTLQHPAESELFDEALSCELALPVQFLAGSQPGRTSAAEGLLRAVALVEDSRGEDLDERSEGSSLQLQRLEAKLDLAMVLLGRLVRQQGQELPLRPLRWSRRGIRLQLGRRSSAAPGQHGVLRLQPSDWLPDHIDLPVEVLAEAADGNGSHYLWLRFAALGDGLEMAMERHLFRLHRRQVAEVRRQR